MRVLIAVILNFGSVLFAAVPDARDAAALLASLPPQRMLDDAAHILASPDNIATPESPQMAHAREVVQKARDIVPKLRGLIRIGASVFDYPGLLARGTIRWEKSDKEYELYLGVFLKPEGGDIYDFKIRFDDHGIIRDVRSVVWKS